MTEGNALWQELCAQERAWLLRRQYEMRLDDGSRCRVDALTREQLALPVDQSKPLARAVLNNERDRHAETQRNVSYERLKAEARALGLTTMEYRALQMRARRKAA